MSDTKTETDLNIRLVMKSGNPTLYAFYCENIFIDDCYFNNERVQKERKLLIFNI